jgi:hypothetical protein
VPPARPLRDPPSSDRQLIEGEQRGRPRYAEVDGERARRGKAGAWRYDAFQNGLPDARVDLFLSSVRGARVDANQQAVQRQPGGPSAKVVIPAGLVPQEPIVPLPVDA